MSKKNKKTKRAKASSRVASAYRSSLKGGSYGAAIAERNARAAERALGQAFGAAMAKSEKEIGRAFGAAMSGAARSGKSPARALSAAEKKARKAVQDAIRKAAGQAARLPGKPRRGGKKKVAAKKATRRVTRHTGVNRTVTADQVVREAASKALKRWACEGARRSGCGAGGSRVITATGSFKRIRPPRFMTGG